MISYYFFDFSDFPAFYIPTTGSIDYVCHLPDELGSRSCDHIPENYDYKICQVSVSTFYISGFFEN